MKGVLLKKLIGLGRDEDGAALIITLALFMFLYAACAGVFAIGQTVKDKIHLQNACDAAAYSAAVVQADTLSRIATINRAMSWTYASLCNREMDYITHKWLDHTVGHYRQDSLVAKFGGGAIVAQYPGFGPDCVFLNNGSGGWMPRCLDVGGGVSVESLLERFRGLHLKNNVGSFYLKGGGKIDLSVLQEHIRADKSNIEEMNAAVIRLRNGLYDQAINTSRWVLEMNMPDKVDTMHARIDISEAEKYMTFEDDEERFLRYSDREEMAKSGYFPAWYMKCDGIVRNYDMGRDPLVAEWDWWVSLLGKRKPGLCPHIACSDSRRPDSCIPLADHCHARLTAGMLNKDDDCYDGQLAQPLILTKDYFGAKGTITVGVAKYNENPWTKVFRRIAGYMADGDRSHGIYGLFNPYRYVEWTWAVSSAKAGYQYRETDPNGIKREYRVNYETDAKAKWNLCTSDWDAVFVPVRQSHAFAGSGNAWDSAGRDFLEDLFERDLEDDISHAPSYHIAGRMPNLPLMHNGGGAIRNLNWRKLADLTFH